MTVSEQIVQVIEALCEKFGIVIDWTSANVLPYISTLCAKLISYEIWTSVAWIAFMLVLSIIAIILAKVLYKPIHDGFERNDLWPIFTVISLTAVWVLSVLVIGTQIMDIIKCITFPELYIVEYIADMIESK